MAMFETILQIQGQNYPFGQASNPISVGVEEQQVFSQLGELLQKRREMSRKSKLLDSPSLIKLLSIYQQDLTLHYLYEYVPYPLSTYLPRKLNQDAQCGRSIIKRLSFDLTVLISYLVGMKLELQLSVANIGLTEEQKMKVFMSSRCRMGHKSEISLIAYYRHCKQKILAFLECQLAGFTSSSLQDAANFVIKGNKLVFPKKDLNESIYSCGVDLPREGMNHATNQSDVFSSRVYSGAENLSTASCINPQQQAFKLRQTQSPRYGRTLNFSQAKDSKGRSHKNSFQFGTRKGKGDKFYTEQEEDTSDAKSYTHSRSIRIQFQQKFDPNAPKKRKESCKMKVTTFHQYQLDDVNPQDLFHGQKSNIFQQFTKKSEQQEEGEFVQKTPFRKNPPAHMPSTSGSSSRLHLQQKVRLAKEKAETLLNKFMSKKPQKGNNQ